MTLKEFKDSLTKTIGLYEKIKTWNLRSVARKEQLEKEINLDCNDVMLQSLCKGFLSQNPSNHPVTLKLKDSNICVDSSAIHDKLAVKLDELSFFVVENASVLEKIRNQISGCVQSKNATININLPQDNNRKIVITFVEKVYEIGMLKNVEISSDGVGLELTFNMLPTVKRFFISEYYERYIRVLVYKYLKSKKIQVDSLYNLKVSLMNGINQELDIVFLLNSKDVLWIEIKSSQNVSKDDIQKYIFIGHIMKVNYTNSIIVLRGSSKENNHHLSNVLPMLVVDGKDLVLKLDSLLDTYLKTNSAVGATSIKARVKPIRRIVTNEKQVNNGK